MSGRLSRRKLAHVLDRLGSPFDGEVVAAGVLADRMVRRAGETWHGIVGGDDHQDGTRRGEAPRHVAMALALLREHGGLLNEWEIGFARGLLTYSKLSDRQAARLKEICDRVAMVRAAAGDA